MNKDYITDPWKVSAKEYWLRECNLVSTWATLAVDIYRHSNGYTDANSRHLFVASVSRVFETMRLRIARGSISVLQEQVNETITPLANLLSHMVDALRWSLVNYERDCGAYISLPWVKDILQCYEAARDSVNWYYEEPLEAIPLTGDETVRPTLLLNLRLLEACLDCGLLSGETSEKDFNKLLLILEEPTLPKVPLDVLAAVVVLEAENTQAVEQRAAQRAGNRQVLRVEMEAAQKAAQKACAERETERQIFETVIFTVHARCAPLTTFDVGFVDAPASY